MAAVSYVTRRFIASLAPLKLDLRWDTALRDFRFHAELDCN